MGLNNAVLVVAPTQAGCDQLQGLLQNAGVELSTLVLGAGTAPRAELVVLDLGTLGADALDTWSAKASALPLIVIGPGNDAQLMRRAMQAGARDFLGQPVAAEQLQESVRRILQELPRAAPGERRGRLTAVITAKGGSGGSFIACNLAHILAAHLGRETALLDMDLQFGALPLALDLNTRDTLLEALGGAEHLDPVALKGYMTKHKSGLHVLGAMSEQLIIPAEVSVEAVQRLLAVALQVYEHVVVDLPRQIDNLTGLVLASADRVLVVTQQSFSHLRDTKRMFGLLQGYVGVPAERISLVINRHHERHSISADDFVEAVRPADLLLVSNDFAHVTEALNLGIPVYDGARNAPVTKALCTIAERLDAGEQAPPPRDKPARGMLQRVLGFGK